MTGDHADALTDSVAVSAVSDRLFGMSGSDPKADLHHYLQAGREALLWKLDGLSEYDIRRPLTPTGTNLLGLVKHVASMELGGPGHTRMRRSTRWRWMRSAMCRGGQAIAMR